MDFLFDENMPKRLAKGLQILDATMNIKSHLPIISTMSLIIAQENILERQHKVMGGKKFSFGKNKTW